MIEGNSVKATIRAVATPIIIIQPKVMIGRMPLTMSEPKATMVVRAVYRQGRNMLSTAWRSILPWRLKWRVARNSR